ncbi:MAG: response regulator [Spirochaetales bacterium]|nr:response regulator [Spirochaetales bacterium]
MKIRNNFFYKNKLYLVLIGIFLVIISCSENRNNEFHTDVVKGFIDISHIPQTDQKKIELKGEWEFYWNQLYEPFDFKTPQPIEGDFINVPGNWVNYKGDIYKPKRYGYATYRLNMKVRKDQDYALNLPVIWTAYKFWINDLLISTGGKVSKEERFSEPTNKPRIVYYRSTSEEAVITLQMSNYDALWGGMANSFIIGDVQTIQQDLMIKRFYENFFFGVIFIFAIYHFALFFFWKKDYSTLLFGAYCFGLAVRTLLVANGFIFSMDLPGWAWEFGYRLNYLGTYLGAPFLMFYLYYHFKKEHSKIFVYGVSIAATLMAVLVLVTPYKIYVNTLVFYQVIMAMITLYLVVVFSLAIYHKREGAVLSAIGIFCFAIAAFNDVLYVNSIIHTRDLTPLGLFALILSQALVIARRFSKAFARVEDYSEKLEEKVKIRTQQLEEATNQKTHFFINFAHEIKTPLTLIMNYMSKDIEKRGLSQELTLVQQNMIKLKRDIINFLDIEKLNMGKVYYDHDQILNISTAVSMKYHLFKELADKKNIKLKCDIDDNNYFIKIDPFAIDRIINNIVLNAIIHTEPGGTVSLKLYRFKENICLSVSDTGIGISEEQQKHLFEPFYQMSREKRSIQGIGLGLSIVKKILDDIHADINVSSKERKGTVFTIYFSSYSLKEGDTVVSEENYTKPMSVNFNIPKTTDNYNIEKPNILLVEDNTDMIIYMQEALETDYNFFYAVNGMNALQKLKEIPKPDLIISDIMMDEMDGYDFYKALIRDSRYNGIPFIFLTAKTTEDEKLKGLSLGAVDFIYKPFSIEVLRVKINSLIQNREATKEANRAELEKKISMALRSEEESAEEKVFRQNRLFKKYKITSREKDIILLLIKGLEYKVISSQLNISFNTLKPYITKIYRKLNVQNKVELTNLFN